MATTGPPPPPPRTVRTPPAPGPTLASLPGGQFLSQHIQVISGLAKAEAFKKVWAREAAARDVAHQLGKKEPFPAVESVWEDVFAGGLPPSYPTKGGS